jgi:hypothetical protein
MAEQNFTGTNPLLADGMDAAAGNIGDITEFLAFALLADGLDGKGAKSGLGLIMDMVV